MKLHQKQVKILKLLGIMVIQYWIRKNTNYSFGSLQRALKKGLKYIGYERIRNFESILILGVAGGSVIETLNKEVKFDGKITGVEILSN